MNRALAIQQLLAVLESILALDECMKEILTIIVGSGIEKRFFKTLIQRLKLLEEYGVSVIEHHTEFEPLGNHLFSMHLDVGDKNVRILYSFLPDGNAVLLLAFHERAGKKKTDYSSHIPAAKHRFQTKMEENGYAC